MEQYANDSATTLDGTINSSVTSLDVIDGSVFPASGDFRVKIDSEIMKVTARSINTLTVVRGQESTTAAGHTDGVAVAHVLTVEGLSNLGSVINSFGAIASRPSAQFVGRIYRPTDSIFPQYDIGSAWRNMYMGMVLDKTIPQSATLLAGAWAWRNQGSATVTDYNDGFVITQPTSATENMRGLIRAVPSTPYTFVAGIQGAFPYNQYHRAGIYWHDGTKSQCLCFVKALTSFGVGVDSFTNDTTYSSTPASINVDINGGVGFLRLRDDGTNRYFDFSPDNVFWTNLYTITRTSHLTPTHYGIFGNNNNNTYGGTQTKCFYINEY